MDNFEYFAPTKVVFGKDVEAQTGKLLKAQGCKKILLHYGGQSAKKSGLLDRIEASLTAEEIEYVSLGGVVPNPRLSLARKGIELCKQEGVDFILAVGGGSVIDSAKCIGYGLTNDGDVWDFYEKLRTPAACMPIGTVLTIAAAGSEMSNSSVITNDEETPWKKKGCSSNLSRAKFAIMNPDLTKTLPPYQTASGCADIMMHTMERYFTRTESPMELTDQMAEGLLRTMIRNSKILVDDPENYDARAEVMWASSLSHNGLTGCGTDGGDWACHQLEHELGASYDVTHGAGLAAVWGSWARYVYKDKPDRFLKYALNVMQVTPTENEEATILLGIEAMEDFYRSINMPTSLRELGIKDLTEEEIIALGKRCSYGETRTIGKIRKLNAEEISNIYRMAQ